ncbi:MAG: ribose 5-phosphate isomerase B [Thermodesulfobacteriota bacterium]
MKAILGSDHAGFELKAAVKAHLEKRGLAVTDAGTHSTERCDFPVYALKVARAVAAGEFERGILICGTGLGMSMAANRVPGARAALCTTEYQARMSRAHNNANLLCLGQRVIGQGLALAILDVWLETPFEGGRYQQRLDSMESR